MTNIPRGLLGKAYLRTIAVAAVLIAAAVTWWLFGFWYALIPLGALTVLLMWGANDSPTGLAG
jgi:hypothetical protein